MSDMNSGIGSHERLGFCAQIWVASFLLFLSSCKTFVDSNDRSVDDLVEKAITTSETSNSEIEIYLKSNRMLLSLLPLELYKNSEFKKLTGVISSDEVRQQDLSQLVDRYYRRSQYGNLAVLAVAAMLSGKGHVVEKDISSFAVKNPNDNLLLRIEKSTKRTQVGGVEGMNHNVYRSEDISDQTIDSKIREAADF